MAVLVAIAAVTYLWRTPAALEPIEPSSTVQAAAQPALATRETVASEAALPAPATRQAAPRREVAAPSDDPLIRPPTVGASAAMRDYGQIVISAFNGGSPKLLSEAVNLMSICRFNPDLTQMIERMRADGRLAGEAGNIAIEAFSERGRKCQSIPPDLMAREKELAERALLAGSRKVAAIYGELVGFDPPPSMRAPLKEALRTDFFGGDDIAPLMLARHPDVFDLSRIETRAYEIAFDALDNTRTSRSKRPRTPFEFDKPTPPYTDDEQKQADLLAQTWLRSVKKPDPSPG
ncbi:hypothetical protein [Roseateles chitinivorans]|uniref:hypothetical protein n=1 Tax=Roseateles chitinivorans TaxID=2917965 RepID=UPI003D66619B